MKYLVDVQLYIGHVLSRVPGSRKTFPSDAKYNPIYLSYIVGVNIVKRIAMLSLLVV